MDRLSETPATGSPHYGPATVRVSYRSAVDGREDWALVEPGTGATWAVILHGHGSHGDQLYTRADIATTWLPVLRERGLNILSPNLRDNAWMCPAAVADLHALLGHVRSRYGAQRILLMSGSMGGTGALIYTVRHPSDIAGVAALCPATDLARYLAFCRDNPGKRGVLTDIAGAIERAYGGTPADAPDVYRAHSALHNAAALTMPVYLCHGDADVIIPVEESRTLADALRRQGTPHRYVELKNGHHDSPIPYKIEALEWLLHTLAPPAAR